LVRCDWRNRKHQKREAYSKLRPGRERPRHRAAKQHDEIAPLHSITSSASASSVGGTSMASALAVLV
jgi:hypothetical protein